MKSPSRSGKIRVLIVGYKSHKHGKNSLLEGSTLIKLGMNHLGLETDEITEILLPSKWMRIARTLSRPKKMFKYFVQTYRMTKSFNKINLIAYLHDTESLLWHKKILKVEPNYILGIGIPISMLKVAKTLGIETIEIQHGIIDLETIRDYWFLREEGSFQYPTKYLAWDQYFIETLKETDMQLEVMHEYSRIFKKLPNAQKYDYMYCLQYKQFLGFSYAVLIKPVAKHLIAHKKEKLSIRLHPLTNNLFNRIYVRIILKRKQISFSFVGRGEFINILPQTACVVTGGSSVIWESHFAGKKIVLAGKLREDWYKPEIIRALNFLESDQ